MPVPVGPHSDHSPASRGPTTGGRWRRAWRLIPHDAYAIAAYVIFACIVVCCWDPWVGTHEELYFLGPRRIANPGFLANDFTWSTQSPTTALFDHLLAPLWGFLSPFAIANLGRAVFWGLMAWSLVRLARTIEMPAWAVAAGFALWLLWGQTLGLCGSPFEGFQPKSLAYPLSLLSLSYALRGQVVRAGLAAGLGTAFHIVIGGWSLMALCVSMLVNRRLFTLRQVGVLLLAAAPFVAPLVLGIELGFGARATASEMRAMQHIYVMFAEPDCCDVFYFLSSSHVAHGWIRAAAVFAMSLAVVFTWHQRRAARMLGAFTATLIAFFAAGVLGRFRGLDALLQLFPFQLANALPALMLFMFVVGAIGVGGATRRLGRVGWVLVLAGTAWLAYDRRVPAALLEKPRTFANNLRTALSGDTELGEPICRWIRERTPPTSVFITPFIAGFWPYAERAQVASMRQPPLDRRLIEWKERLEAINGSRPFSERGWDTIDELEVHERQLSIPELIRIRTRYGATHYLATGQRPDLAACVLHAEGGYSVYALDRLREPEGPR